MAPGASPTARPLRAGPALRGGEGARGTPEARVMGAARPRLGGVRGRVHTRCRWNTQGARGRRPRVDAVERGARPSQSPREGTRRPMGPPPEALGWGAEQGGDGGWAFTLVPTGATGRGASAGSGTGAPRVSPGSWAIQGGAGRPLPAPRPPGGSAGKAEGAACPEEGLGGGPRGGGGLPVWRGPGEAEVLGPPGSRGATGRPVRPRQTARA